MSRSRLRSRQRCCRRSGEGLAVPRLAPEPTEFLNVDLDIEGRAAKVDALVRELDRKLMCLHSEVARGKRVAHYELSSGRTQTVESTLRGLLRVIEGLPADAR